ncbi:MAG: XdhC/CoxI family protein [Dehalococcoidia bacterium]|nr:XdhC/CoxI family protein [Dehalococcoidia bacterium]
MRDQSERTAITVEVERALDGGEAVAVATVTDPGEASGDGVEAGAKMLVRTDGSTLGSIAAALDGVVAAAAVEQLRTAPRIIAETLWVSAGRATERRSQASEGDAQVLVQLFESPARLVIVGGGHIGYALAQIAALLGFEISVLDDREEFASEERFAMADDVYAGDLGEGLDAMTFDASDYVVLVSRGHQQDEQALRHVVERGAAYVGMIGSRRRVRTVLEDLIGEGVSRELLEAVHTPIGIDIGAETPEEIALSILSEVVLVRRGGGGGRMEELRQALRDQ